MRCVQLTPYPPGEMENISSEIRSKKKKLDPSTGTGIPSQSTWARKRIKRI
jgi:hypothetical protein